MLPHMITVESGEEFISHITLDEYAEWYKDFAVLTRDDRGVLTIRLHTDGGPAVVSRGMHMAMSAVLKYAGMDPENELIIITGTGDELFAAVDPFAGEQLAERKATSPLDIATNLFSLLDEATGIRSSVLFDVNVPTIGVINGPTHAGQTHLFAHCDITLAAEDATFYDNHYERNVVPGDGLFQMMQHYAGEKRANRFAYTGDTVDAEEALRLGIVSEVLPRDQLMDRALEYADQIMKADKYVRTLTHATMRQKALRHVAEDLQTQLAYEGWGGALSMIDFVRKDGGRGVSI